MLIDPKIVRNSKYLVDSTRRTKRSKARSRDLRYRNMQHAGSSNFRFPLSSICTSRRRLWIYKLLKPKNILSKMCASVSPIWLALCYSKLARTLLLFKLARTPLSLLVFGMYHYHRVRCADLRIAKILSSSSGSPFLHTTENLILEYLSLKYFKDTYIGYPNEMLGVHTEIRSMYS